MCDLSSVYNVQYTLMSADYAGRDYEHVIFVPKTRD